MKDVRETFVITPGFLDVLESKSTSSMGLAGRWRLKHLCISTALLCVAIRFTRPPIIPIIGLCVLFVLDYLIYRKRHRVSLKRDIMLLREFTNKGPASSFYENDTVQDFELNTIEDFGRRSIHDVNPIHYVRRLMMEYICRNGRFSGNCLVDVGCNYGIITEAFKRAWKTIIGTDLQSFNLSEYKRRLRSTPILADANHFPFKENRVDGVSFMEIIEHLTDPFPVLEGIRKTLMPKGKLLLTTNNRHEILWEYLLNPLIVAEKILGIFLDSILPARPLVWRGFNDSLVYYHTAYSKREITRILETAGFTITNITSFPLCTNAYSLFNAPGTRITEAQFARYQYLLSRLCMWLPCIRYLGGHWLIIAEKK